MAANTHVKMENDTAVDDFGGVLLVNNVVENEYLEYEESIEAGYENESLIEYTEEEVQNDDCVEYESVESRIKTHTLTINRLIVDGQYQEVFRCLECDIDFATVEDFTKLHQEMQKKQIAELAAEAFEKETFQCEKSNNEQPFLAQREQGWMVVKDEQIVKQENDAHTFTDNAEGYVEISENIIESTEFEEIGKLESETDLRSEDEALAAVEDEDEGEKYFCCDCQLVFSDLESAEQHVCSALNSGNGDVDACAVDEVDNATYDNNLRIYLEAQNKTQSAACENENKTTEVQHHCLECGKKFHSLQGLQIHSRSHKPKQAKNKKSAQHFTELKCTTCPLCNTTFSSVKNLRLHMKIHDVQQVRTIEQALPAGAKTQYNDMNKFFCEICNKSFEQNLLGIHKNMHQQTTEYKCDICNRHFENKSSYGMHMQMHADKPTKSRKQQLKSDGNNDNVKRDGRFPCQYCGRTFQRPFEKVRHERVHTGEKPHACEVCGKTFRVSYSLTLHLRTHTDIRPYVCATCNKRFKSQPVYAHHLRTHESERAYKCETCSKSFRTSVQLSAHRNTHSKPYNCLVCNRPFASLYSVKIHMKTHKANRIGYTTKYRCYICGAEYARISALRLHMKDLHLIDFDTNQSLELDDAVLSGDDQNTQYRQSLEEIEDEDENEVDQEAAVLIAAAAEADCAAYIEAATDDASPGTSSLGLHSQANPPYEVTLQNDELIVDNYQTEEIVADWLSN